MMIPVRFVYCMNLKISGFEGSHIQHKTYAVLVKMMRKHKIRLTEIKRYHITVIKYGFITEIFVRDNSDQLLGEWSVEHEKVNARYFSFSKCSYVRNDDGSSWLCAGGSGRKRNTEPLLC